MLHRLLVLIAVMCATLALQADEAAPPPATAKARAAGTFTFYFENDAFNNTDRNYTNGVKLSWLTADLAEWGQTGWRQSFLEALPFVNHPRTQKNFGFALGQNIYTPQDTKAVIPDPNDRPYAGWTYVELSFFSKTEKVADTIAIQVGMVGPDSHADDTQRLVHKWLGNSRPNGWNHQLQDEFGLNLVYEHQWRMYGRALGDQLGVDLVPHAGASLGNVQTYANLGGTLRLGFNLPSDFGVQLIRPGGGGNSPIDDRDPRVAADRSWSFFIFGAVDGRAVARDIFLDGNTFKDSPRVDKEPFVADLCYGVGLIAGRWQLTFTQVRRTQEFKTQPYPHNDFGSVTFSCAF